MGRISRAYVIERLCLMPEAGVAIEDEFWITLAGQIIQSKSVSHSRQLGDGYRMRRRPAWHRRMLSLR